jgi:hypothetical protein
MSNFSGMTFVIILLIFILLISLVRLASTVVTFSAIIILVFGAIRMFRNKNNSHSISTHSINPHNSNQLHHYA